MTNIPVAADVEVGKLCLPSGCSVASSIGRVVESPSKDSVAGGGPRVIGTRSVGRAILALYRALSSSLINTHVWTW